MLNRDTGEVLDYEKYLNAQANKLDKYCATMRTNTVLMDRCKFVTSEVIEKFQKELGDILEQGILSYPQTLGQLGISKDHSLHERKEILGIPLGCMNMSDKEKTFLKDMANKAVSSRKNEWSWRITQEAKEKHKLGWYPFFVTLTVDPKMADPEKIWRNSKYFREYIRDLADIVCRELDHPLCRHKPYNPESDYVTYAGVIEHGASREHHHGHFMIWMREIPPGWKNCPNKYIVDPLKRFQAVCPPMQRLWKYSVARFSPPKYFRYKEDIWEKKHGFVWPLSEKTREPLASTTLDTAGFYVTKYMQKEHKKWKHRMRCTRNLGMKAIKQKIMMMEKEQVEALTWRAENSRLNHSLMMIHTVPQGLLRRLAKQRDFYLKYRENRLDFKELVQKISKPFIKMLRSVRNGARPDRMDSSEFYDWVAEHLPDQKGYCRERLVKAHKLLEVDFKRVKYKPKMVKIGGNIYESA